MGVILSVLRDGFICVGCEAQIDFNEEYRGHHGHLEKSLHISFNGLRVKTTDPRESEYDDRAPN